MLNLNKIIIVFFSFTFLCMAQSDKKTKKVNEPSGPVARELKRRMTLRQRLQKKSIDSEGYFSRLYKPTVVGCQESIKESKKAAYRLKAKRSKTSKSSSKAKYTKAIELYDEYSKLLETAIELVTVKKDYNKLCMTTFPEIKDVEKKIARVTGTRIKRDWLMTTELYPKSFKKESSDDKKNVEEKGKKSSKSKSK